jgi:hypothetical protein
MGNYMVPNTNNLNTSVDGGDGGNYDEVNASFSNGGKIDSRGGKRNAQNHNNTVDGVKASGRFRSIQAKGQGNMIQNLNINLVNQNNGHNPNNSIDIGQLPMRLVS